MGINPRAMPGRKVLSRIGFSQYFGPSVLLRRDLLRQWPIFFSLWKCFECRAEAHLTLGSLPSCNKHLAHLSLILLEESCPLYTRASGKVEMCLLPKAGTCHHCLLSLNSSTFPPPPKHVMEQRSSPLWAQSQSHSPCCSLQLALGWQHDPSRTQSGRLPQSGWV